MTKLNSLEDKIKEYLNNLWQLYEKPSYGQQAHDIAEICEKEYGLEYNIVITDDTYEWWADYGINRFKFNCSCPVCNKTTTMIVNLEANNSIEKENIELKNKLNSLCKDCQGISDLKQQIDRLHKNEIIYHKRLKDIKYLDRQEVEHIVGAINCNEDKVNAICNLAIQPITKDKILEVLENHFGSLTNDGHTIIKQIANEILKVK